MKPAAEPGAPATVALNAVELPVAVRYAAPLTACLRRLLGIRNALPSSSAIKRHGKPPDR